MMFFLTLLISFTALFVVRNVIKNEREGNITFRFLGTVSALLTGVFGVLTVMQGFTHITEEDAGMPGYFSVVSEKVPGPAFKAAKPSVTIIRHSTPVLPHVALVSKVVLDVTRKQASREWQIARRGETLSSGDRVKTGKNSAAVIKFKDHSLVRVRERSEVAVMGTTKKSLFSKSVNLDNGAVEFSIKKQKSDEEFRITSPTSVASIRGTGGKFTSGGFSDTLTLIEGAVILTNMKSSRSVEVKAGYTGISDPDGTISVRKATSHELRTANGVAGEGKETMQEFVHNTIVANRLLSKGP